MIIIAGQIKTKITDWVEAQQQIDTIVAAVEAEAGCISYRLYTDPKDRTTLFIFEEWETPEALVKHRTQPHMGPLRDWLQKVQAQSSLDRYVVESKGKL